MSESNSVCPEHANPKLRVGEQTYIHTCKLDTATYPHMRVRQHSTSHHAFRTAQDIPTCVSESQHARPTTARTKHLHDRAPARACKAHCKGAQNRGCGLTWSFRKAFGVDHARGQRVDADAVRFELRRHCSGAALEREFGRDVWQDRRQAHFAWPAKHGLDSECAAGYIG